MKIINNKNVWCEFLGRNLTNDELEQIIEDFAQDNDMDITEQ